MFVNSHSPESTQVNSMLMSRNDQAIHLRNKFRYYVHRSLYTPLPM
jgi:hypothetical protein